MKLKLDTIVLENGLASQLFDQCERKVPEGVIIGQNIFGYFSDFNTNHCINPMDAYNPFDLDRP